MINALCRTFYYIPYLFSRRHFLDFSRLSPSSAVHLSRPARCLSVVCSPVEPPSCICFALYQKSPPLIWHALLSYLLLLICHFASRATRFPHLQSMHVFLFHLLWVPPGARPIIPPQARSTLTHPAGSAVLVIVRFRHLRDHPSNTAHSIPLRSRAQAQHASAVDCIATALTPRSVRRSRSLHSYPHCPPVLARYRYITPRSPQIIYTRAFMHMYTILTPDLMYISLSLFCRLPCRQLLPLCEIRAHAWWSHCHRCEVAHPQASNDLIEATIGPGTSKTTSVMGN